MKKLLLTTLLLALFCLPLCAAAEEAQVSLPFSVAFGMDLAQTAEAAGENAIVEEWEGEEGTGAVMLESVPLGIGDIQVNLATLYVSTNNSDKAPRLDSLELSIAFEGSCIAAFHETMEALTAVYGIPDGYPYDEYGKESYQEYGNLGVSWTTPEVRIYLSMSQSYSENGTVDLSYAYRLNYDVTDLAPYEVKPVG